MKNWHESSASFEHWKDFRTKAIELWSIDHPDEMLDYTKAFEALAKFLDQEQDHFRLDNRTNPLRVEADISRSAPICPGCGQPLNFQSITLCPVSNPRRHTGLFYCGPAGDEAEGGCGYHAYTTEGLLDIRSKGFHDIIKIEGQ